MEVDSEQLFAILAMLYFIERKLGGGFQKKNVHPYLRKIPILINIFQMGWFNHQLENIYGQRLLETFHDVSVFLSGFFSTTLKSTRGSLGKVVCIFSSARQGGGAIFQMEKY